MDVECVLVLKTRTRNLLVSEYLDLAVTLNKDQNPFIEEDPFCRFDLKSALPIRLS